MLTAAADPEVALGSFAKGVRVGPRARLPWLPALKKAKRRWRLSERADPENQQDEAFEGDTARRKNYSSVAELSEKVVEVLRQKAERGLMMAPLGALRKDDLFNVVPLLLDGEWLELRHCPINTINRAAYEHGHRSRSSRFMRATGECAFASEAFHLD